MASLQNNIKVVVAKLLKSLNDRNRDVVSRRFGLKSGQKETLESIGQEYGITRERVRQIEAASIKQIKDQLRSGLYASVEPYINLAGSILEEHGGVMTEKELFNKFSGTSEDTAVNGSLVFFLNLQSSFARVSEDDELNTFWALSEQHNTNCRKAMNSLTEALSKKGIVSESDMVDFYNKNVAAKDTSPKFVASIISISKKIGRNAFGQIGLSSWPEIKPRGVKDRAYLVLKRDNKPRHFREIAELINSQGSWGKVANVQTVHNKLIKDGRFVLVGRGLYALKEWGFKAGTVKDVVKDIIKSSDKALGRDQIIKQVLSHRMVKANTIALSLQDRKHFIRNNDGTYTLKKA